MAKEQSYGHLCFGRFSFSDSVSLFSKNIRNVIAAEKLSDSASPLDLHGALKVDQANLVDSHGEKYQLRGMSTHGLAWFPQYVSRDTFLTLRDDWQINCIRLALYTEEYGGYCSGGNQEELKTLVKKGLIMLQNWAST